MKRGTTPVVIMKIKNLQLANIERVIVTIKQKATEMSYEKEYLDIDPEDGVVKLYMPQSDTLRLVQGSAQIQIRIRLSDGTALATNIASISVGDILKEGLI